MDRNTALSVIGSSDLLSAAQWLHVAVASAIWVLVPSAIGAWRVERAEID